MWGLTISLVKRHARRDPTAALRQGAVGFTNEISWSVATLLKRSSASWVQKSGMGYMCKGGIGVNSMANDDAVSVVTRLIIYPYLLNKNKTMISFKKRKSGLITRYPIVGGRRLSNYWWSFVIFLGGCGFLLTGISSFFKKNLWVLPSGAEQIQLKYFVQPFSFALFHLPSDVPLGGKEQGNNFNDFIGDSTTQIDIPFFPQGLVLAFYGFLGLSFSFHLWFQLYWKVGGGFNEFNKKDQYVRIFRWGRPGKNRRIDLKYTNDLIEAIKVELSPRPALFLRIKGEKNIPLTRIGDFIPLEELEAQAAELTSFMQIPLEMEN